MRLLLGLPTAGSPSQPFLDSLKGLRAPKGCVDFQRSVVSGNFIVGERELLAEEALAGNFDVLAMIDDDVVVPPDALELLCGALDDDPQTALTGALYYSRDGLRPMAVDDWNGADTTRAVVPAFGDREAVTVDGVGFACVVVRVEALRALEPPFFSAHVFVERGRRRVRLVDEDYLFCERLRKAGMRVRLHGGVRCGHYDRAAKRVVPERWESPEATNRRRMYVRTPTGEALVDADDSLAQAREEHRPLLLDYLLVD